MWTLWRFFTMFQARSAWKILLALTVLETLAYVSALSSVKPPHSQQIGDTLSTDRNRFVVLGGNGRIGTAVAIHLLQRDPKSEVVLVGRRPLSDAKVQSAVNEVLEASGVEASRVQSARISNIWGKDSRFQDLIDTADCLIHTAGPYLDRKPLPLQVAIDSPKCRAYVDVSDPLPYLEQSILMSHDAEASNLTAMVSAGAFPGMSNVLAMEAAGALGKRVQDVRFQYFTAGLGGSGVVNLYITNLGFGEPMVQYENGVLRFFMALSGLLLGEVNFSLPTLQGDKHDENADVQQRIGKQTIFAWPFPEAATVPKHLKASGNSYAAMGTAPAIWNVMLGVLVNVVPRPWWKNEKFSKFLADFSEPLVRATDALLQKTATEGSSGETHAMRVDVTSIAGPREEPSSVSIVQGHDSFRVCVGQSCAEFAMDLMENPRPGVYLPEQFYDDSKDRSRIIPKLTTTPGTFCYTGPVASERSPPLPSNWDDAINQAVGEEEQMMRM